MGAGFCAGGDGWAPGFGLSEAAGGFSNCGFTCAGAGEEGCGAVGRPGAVGAAAGGCWPAGLDRMGAADGVTGMPLQIFSSYLKGIANW